MIVVIDATKVLGSSTISEEYLFKRLAESEIPATLVVNKIDLLSDPSIASPVIERYSPMYKHFKHTSGVSALEGQGIKELLGDLLQRAQPRPWLYPADQKDDMPDLKKVEELIRAEFFKRLHRYIPYMLRQENVGWTEFPDGLLQIDQIIYVERDSQIKIVLGTGGSLFTSAVADAKIQIARALKRRIKLKVQIKVRSR